MSASSARQALYDLLRDALPAPTDDPLGGFDVLPYARDVDPPARPVVMLRPDGVARDEAAPLARRRYTFAVILLVPSSTPDLVDDDLDAGLELLLDAIETAPKVPQWTAAQRVLFGASERPAYEVTLPFTARIERLGP